MKGVKLKFSIIIPTYNSGDKLEYTLKSIINQTFSKYEIIIQDGLSLDITVNIAKKYQLLYSNISLFSEKDSGVYDAMNKAVNKSTGDFCIILGAGDELIDEKVLEDLARKIEKYAVQDIIYGYVLTVDNNEKKVLKRKINWIYKIKCSPVCHQSICANRKLLIAYPFDTKYMIAADQDWIMKLLKKGKKFKFIDRAIAYYPMDGMSSKNNERFVYEQKKIHKQYYPKWQFLRQTWRKITGKE